MNKRLSAICLILLLLAAPLSAKVLSKVAAVVNDEIITSYQLEKEVVTTLASKAEGKQLSAEEFGLLRNQVLNRLVNETLVQQRIAELGLQVSSAELEGAIEDVQRQNKLTRKQLETAVEAQGMDFERYREKLRREILRYKLLGREVNRKVEVTNQEIRDYFREHIDDYRAQPKVRLSQISFPIPKDATEEQLAAVTAQAAKVRSELQAGEEFAAVLAAQGKMAEGGDMGNLVEEELNPRFRDAVAGLEIGQVSQPVTAGDRIHLFLVTARNPGDIYLFDKVKDEIEEILRKRNTEARFKEWTEELRQKAHVDIRD